MEGRLNGLDLFSGTGGFTLALEPWVKTIAYCENDPHCQAVLLSRMGGRDLPLAPIWDDISTLKAKFLPPVEIIFGGFPCQDLSQAGRKGQGIEGKKSGLLKEMLRVIEETKPHFVFIENVSGSAVKKYVPFLRKELWKKGFTSVSISLPAYSVGAAFRGERVFIAASNRYGKSLLPFNAEASQLPKVTKIFWEKGRDALPRRMGIANGVRDRLDRVREMGNAVVPLQAQKAFEIAFSLLGEI